MKNIFIATKGNKFMIYDLSEEKQIGKTIDSLKEAEIILEFLNSIVINF